MSWVNNVITELRQAMLCPHRPFADALPQRQSPPPDVAHHVRRHQRLARDVGDHPLIRDSFRSSPWMGWLFYLNWQLTPITLVMALLIAVAALL